MGSGPWEMHAGSLSAVWRTRWEAGLPQARRTLLSRTPPPRHPGGGRAASPLWGAAWSQPSFPACSGPWSSQSACELRTGLPVEMCYQERSGRLAVREDLHCWDQPLSYQSRSSRFQNRISWCLFQLLGSSFMYWILCVFHCCYQERHAELRLLEDGCTCGRSAMNFTSVS